MKASIYFNYASRSLVRGGQRTVLAVLCVAVGVLAIVSLQLVGLMINNAFTGNVRNANGGDIAITSNTQPFTKSDLEHFDRLKNDGSLTSYTPTLQASGSTSLSASLTNTFVVLVVDPKTYPVVEQPTFTTPKDGKLSSLVSGQNVLVTQSFIDQYHKKVGDEFSVSISTQAGKGNSLSVKIVGVIANSGVAAQAGSTMYLDATAYQALNPKVELTYDTIHVSTNQDQQKTDAVVKDVKQQFPLANTRTTAEALKSNQDQIDLVRRFLEIAGLLALLIGGVGIVNTMQVLLSRRRTEIAMLKTMGYRRFDLYMLFGLEAAMLGLLGGVIGALVGVGLSALVRNIIVQNFGLDIPLLLDPLTIVGGLLIGLFTALIFGLMPIVQAANIRPLNVIRELPEGNRFGSAALNVLLLILLSVLFCVMAIVILNNQVVLGIGVVYGTFIFLGFLSLFFGLVVFLISKLPVPERLSPLFLLLVVVLGGLSALLTLVLPAFGTLLLIGSALGLIVAFLPRTWKAILKMALLNIGRQGVRTTTTMLALFVGIFTIGLILVLGQDLRDNINNAIANSLTYNVFVIASGDQAKQLQGQIKSVPGLTKDEVHTMAQAVPVSIDDQPIAELLPKQDNPSLGSLGRSGTLGILSSFQGYDLAHNQFPTSQDVHMTSGRNLNASDAGTNNVIVQNELATLEPLKDKIKLGSKLTYMSPDRKSTITVTVVGFYTTTGITSGVLASDETIKALSADGEVQTIFYLKIEDKKVGQAVDKVGQIAKDAAVLNLANIGDFINQLLNYILLTLVAIASLSLFAGIIIIANTVALAMLERRRELGILKSVGYTSSSILGEVILENAVIGGVGAFLAMLVVTLVTSLLGKFFFHTDFGVNEVIVFSLIIGSALLAALTAVLVAWGSVRVRPLEVLRYE
jgi:ABC-type antimicrobial peptide transport system permease subunit